MCMNDLKNYNSSLKIICLTEESVETLFEIGAGQNIVGVSAFVKRPVAAQSLPKVSFFTSSNIKKIKDKKPDLILGFSDIQKDIAKELIEAGEDVWIANHRTIAGILKYIRTLSLMVDKKEEGNALIVKLLDKIKYAQNFAKTLKEKPKIYFEEWDDPKISAIEWVSEVIELCGGINIAKDRASGILAKDRNINDDEIISNNPDIIFACHCGKKVKIDKILERKNYEQIKAIQNKFVFELEPEIFLQPGPAPILDGLDIIIDYIKKWSDLK